MFHLYQVKLKITIARKANVLGLIKPISIITSYINFITYNQIDGDIYKMNISYKLQKNTWLLQVVLTVGMPGFG